jgi:Tat protein translocase TatB subunit
MFGIGYQEMFIVLVVAMVIFGPSRLPELAGQVGRWVRDFRRMSSDLTGEFEKTFAEVDEVKKSFKRELNAIQEEVEGVSKSTRGDLKKTTARTSAKKPAALGAAKTGATKTATAKATDSSPLKTSSLLGKRQKASNGHAAIATKSDPLVDVSYFDAQFVATTTGANGKANGKDSQAEDDALARVRRRRAAAAYARQATV